MNIKRLVSQCKHRHYHGDHGNIWIALNGRHDAYAVKIAKIHDSRMKARSARVNLVCRLNKYAERMIETKAVTRIRMNQVKTAEASNMSIFPATARQKAEAR